MRMSRFVLAATYFALVAAGAPGQDDRGGLDRWGLPDQHDAGPADNAAHYACITPRERRMLADIMRDADARMNTPTMQRGAPPQITFYPLGGDIYGDLHTNNYADLDPSAGILDFDCGNHTYNGHDGHDTGTRTFAEQFIGVPIFAALPGEVIGRDDGHFDQNTSWAGQPANYVIIDHSQIEPGMRTLYWHMKNGSVVPNVGDWVHAGEQIGLVGSSGNSTNPHLHFEVWRNGNWVESMVGPCNPAPPLWAEQWSKPTAHYLRDFGYLRGRLPDDYDWPDPFPRDNSATLTTERIHYWTQGVHLPANSTYRFRFYTPTGALDFDSGTRPLSFSTSGFYRRYWATYTWNITDMRNIPGVWTVAYDLNGERQIDAKVTVLDNGETYTNKPPLPIGALFDPPAPTPDNVVFVRLDTDLAEDDFEYDLVRYRYVWTVDGTVVRDVVSAGHADAIPSLADLGFNPNTLHDLRVEITPNDGTADGFPTLRTVTIGNTCPADTNSDGIVTPADYNAWILAYNQRNAACDQNNDGNCTPADFNAWILNFNAGC